MEAWKYKFDISNNGKNSSYHSKIIHTFARPYMSREVNAGQFNLMQSLSKHAQYYHGTNFNQQLVIVQAVYRIFQ